MRGPLTLAPAPIRLRDLCCKALTLLAIGCGSSSVEFPDEETGEAEGELLAGRRLSEAEVADLLRDAGFPERAVGPMVCTAKYESSFYERASNRNRNGSIDRGLFQINSVHLGRTAGCPRSGNSLFDVSTNVACAYGVFSAQGINAWYGYRAHRYECDRYSVDADNRAPRQQQPQQQPAFPNQQANGGPSCYSPTLGFTLQSGDCVFVYSRRTWLQCAGGQLMSATFSGGPAGACGSTYSAP